MCGHGPRGVPLSEMCLLGIVKEHRQNQKESAGQGGTGLVKAVCEHGGNLQHRCEVPKQMHPKDIQGWQGKSDGSSG